MQIIKSFKLTIVTMLLILVAILMPGSEVPSVGIPHIDKVVHFGMFGTLSLCFVGEYYYKYKQLSPLLIPLLVAELFGVVTEIVQIYVPGRSCDIKDLIADSVGIVSITLLSRYILRQRIKKNS